MSANILTKNRNRNFYTKSLYVQGQVWEILHVWELGYDDKICAKIVEHLTGSVKNFL